MSTNVRAIDYSDSNSKLTLTDIKRVNRKLKRAHSRLNRRVETLRKIRESSEHLAKQIGYLKEDEQALLNPMWMAPQKDY